jgi:hypothetical protein
LETSYCHSPEQQQQQQQEDRFARDEELLRDGKQMMVEMVEEMILFFLGYGRAVT